MVLNNQEIDLQYASGICDNDNVTYLNDNVINIAFSKYIAMRAAIRKTLKTKLQNPLNLNFSSPNATARLES